MKHFSTLWVALLLCATPAQAQTLKSLMFNTTNNTVVSTNRIIFPLFGASGGTATTPSFSLTSGTNTFGLFATTQIGIGPYLGFSVDGSRRFLIATNAIRAEQPISFSTTNIASETRTNLGLGGGITTNITFVDASTNTNSVTISNGIITGWTQ